MKAAVLRGAGQPLRIPLERVNEAFEEMKKGETARSVVVFDRARGARGRPPRTRRRPRVALVTPS